MNERDVEEYLEVLWHLDENKESDMNNFRRHVNGKFDDKTVETLELEGWMKINNNSVRLTKEGKQKAKEIVRRHRLAERLLTDVLGMKAADVEAGACEFEHVLAPEITESICTLLGHPRQCPHGFPIPKGNCCDDEKETALSAVMSLDNGEVGKSYKIAYMDTSSDLRMHKLMHFGISPGIRVKLHQRYPTFVIRSENGQLAMEKNVIGDIYVWKNGNGKRRKQ